MELILASASPRRRELIALLGMPFTVQTAPVDETMDEGADVAEQVAALAVLILVVWIWEISLEISLEIYLVVVLDAVMQIHLKEELIFIQELE